MHKFFKKRFKREQSREKKGKRDETGAGTAAESIGSSSSFLRPVPHIAASGHDGEGSKDVDRSDGKVTVPDLTKPLVGEVRDSADGHDGEGSRDVGRLGWKSMATTTAKSLLRGVVESADAFGPLKSVAGGLCFILENYEVRFPCNVCPRSL